MNSPQFTSQHYKNKSFYQKHCRSIQRNLNNNEQISISKQKLKTQSFYEHFSSNLKLSQRKSQNNNLKDIKSISSMQNIKQFQMIKNLSLNNSLKLQKNLIQPISIQSKFSQKQTADNKSSSTSLKVKKLQEENQILRKQNQFLQQQMLNMANKLYAQTKISNQLNIIQQQTYHNQIKELKQSILVLQGKNSINDEVVKNMQKKIAKLIDENSKLNNFRKQKSELQDIIISLSAKIQKILIAYKELENSVQSNDMQWINLHNRWNQQRLFYTNRIKSLQEYCQNKSKDWQNEILWQS